ncbi:Pimeloyl-ACP methyl ester carboxylesterase [Chelatococcus sambhunathii]|uniref:Pimeloyl-ACP methyl ester carboxylesterase n=1 Tax=Chelatococcus sambhunathii TaxID=363953 RepID=A0ABP2A5U9_9HYPH|nr:MULTISPECIES: alpha/beta fold hydrolase [Chelatococcus]CUA85938.1 Pimeloyl-ACP methyl ester carboxylesterase [Chelatococcus sambhunathii]
MLVPGLNCTGTLFAPQIRALSGKRTVTVAENRLDDTLEGMARRLLAAAPERFALGGLSMGGYVALAVMRLAPERVTRLALLDTTARPDTEEASANRRRLIALAEQGRFEEVHPVLWQRLVARRRLADKLLEGEVRRMMVETGAQAFIRQQRAIMARPDARPDLPLITVPTLVLVGEEDEITPPSVAEEMATAIPASSLVVVPGCGHLSTMERPDAVNAALAAWLQRN